MRFANRVEAGLLLATELMKFKNNQCLVYALPRGGVILGAIVSDYLKCPLDLIITRKIGHPECEECAICAVSETGKICDKDSIKNIDNNWLKAAIEKERIELKRRQNEYLSGRKKLSVKDKTAIIIDDGIATGLTMLAAVNELRLRNPKEIIVAAPIIFDEAKKKLTKVADRVITLINDQMLFGSIGSYYNEFHQVSDLEVKQLLET